MVFNNYFLICWQVGSSQEDTFDPALLTMKRSNYELKKSNGKRVVASERYASESPVMFFLNNLNI